MTHHDDDDGNGGDADDDGVVLDVVHELVIATLEYMTHSSQVHSYMFIYWNVSKHQAVISRWWNITLVLLSTDKKGI